MDDPAKSNAVEIIVRWEGLKSSPDDSKLAYLDMDELRWGDRLDAPVRFRVGGIDLFRGLDPAGESMGFRTLHLLDLALQLCREFLAEEENAYGYLDPWEEYDHLYITIDGDDLAMTADDEETVGHASLAASLPVFQTFVDRVRQLMLDTAEDFATHPQLAPWVRAETSYPSLENRWNFRRSPSRVVLPPSNRDLLCEHVRGLGASATSANSISITFRVDPNVMAEAEALDLSKESGSALISTFFQFALSLRVGEFDFLFSHQVEDGHTTTLNHRYCPILGAVFDLNLVRGFIEHGDRGLRSSEIDDADGARVVECAYKGDHVVFSFYLWTDDGRIPGPEISIPATLYCAEVARFSQEVSDLFETRLPDVHARVFEHVSNPMF
jgi:hypothetical protein